MSEAFVWTSLLDRNLRLRRDAGATWDSIAAELGISRNSVIARAAKLAIPRFRTALPRVRREPEQVEIDPTRPPLPAGHPISWDAINAETQLAGVPYPLPVFV